MDELQYNTVEVLHKEFVSQAPWLTPVILATQEAEIRGSLFELSPGK
jgi:hypothetical protein